MDLQTKHQPQFISPKMRNYKYLCSVVIWYEILSNENIVSKILQGVRINLLVAVEHLNQVKETIPTFRTILLNSERGISTGSITWNSRQCNSKKEKETTICL